MARLLATLSFGAGALLLTACGSSTDSATSDASNPGTGGGASSGPSSNGGSGTAGSKNVGGGGTGGNGGGGAGGGVQKGLSKVGTGEYETFYLVDGTIYAYGGSAGTLGLGSYQGLSIPPRAIDTPAGLKFLDVQGGLHQSMAIDENHKVWTWGDTNDGRQGSGTSGADATVPYQITVDADGNAFDHIVAIEPATNFNSALKDDGSVWMWGDCTNVMPGVANPKNTIYKPTKVVLPDGVKIKQIIAGAVSLLALADDGTVWIWGQSEDQKSLGTGKPDSITPTKVIDLPKNIKQVAAGYSDFYYVLTTDGELYGWGYRWLYIGMYDPSVQAHSYWPQPTPVALKSWLKLPLAVEQVACDQMTTHVILSDGSLWGWGDNPQGEVGNGQELDLSKTCGWDFSTDLWVYHPVQIAKEAGKFKQIFSNSAYDFYTYAMTVDNKLYSWGRNKTGTLGNGVYPLAADGNSGVSSDMSATYPNSWDVTTPTLVDPMHATPKGVNSPCCVADPSGKDCAM